MEYLHAKHLPSRFHCAVFKGELVFPDSCPAVLVSRVRHHIEIRSPHLELSLPVDDGGERCAHQERPLGVTLTEEKQAQSSPVVPYFQAYKSHLFA